MLRKIEELSYANGELAREKQEALEIAQIALDQRDQAWQDEHSWKQAYHHLLTKIHSVI